MKKIILILSVLALPIFCLADDITLNQPENVTPTTFSKIADWRISNAEEDKEELVITYRRKDASGNIIINHETNRNGYMNWYCRNTYQGNNEDCIGPDDPWLCCDGPASGTCPEQVGTCFSDVFNFSIRTQDVGTSIGRGLKLLIWNRMKQDVLTGGNDGTFD